MLGQLHLRRHLCAVLCLLTLLPTAVFLAASSSFRSGCKQLLLLLPHDSSAQWSQHIYGQIPRLGGSCQLRDPVASIHTKVLQDSEKHPLRRQSACSSGTQPLTEECRFKGGAHCGAGGHTQVQGPCWPSIHTSGLHGVDALRCLQQLQTAATWQCWWWVVLQQVLCSGQQNVLDGCSCAALTCCC